MEMLGEAMNKHKDLARQLPFELTRSQRLQDYLGALRKGCSAASHNAARYAFRDWLELDDAAAAALAAPPPSSKRHQPSSYRPAGSGGHGGYN